MSNRRDYRARLYEQYLTACATDKSKLTDKYYHRWARVAVGHFKKLLPQDRKARILDIGCGHGTMLYTLKSLGYENLMGVDCSPEQVELARKIHPQVEEADALEFLKNCTENFDAIFAIDLLEHFTKDEGLEFLDLSWKRLSSGGRILLQVPNADSLRGSQSSFWDLGHEVAYTPHSLKQMLAIAGFENLQVLPTGPVPHGLCSFIRCVLWKFISLSVAIFDIVETSGPGSGTHTRTMIGTGTRKDDSNLELEA